MEYKVGDIVPFAETQEATDWVNSVEGCYYLEDYEPDENGNMQLIVRQLVFPEPTPKEQEVALQKKYTRLIQGILDAEAYALGYTGPGEAVEGACMSVCSYVDTGVSKFDDEGRAFRAWRSAVWALGYEILAEVKAGKREIPSVEELLALLPKLDIVYTEPEQPESGTEAEAV